MVRCYLCIADRSESVSDTYAIALRMITYDY